MMFVIIWVTLLLSVIDSDAATGVPDKGRRQCQNGTNITLDKEEVTSEAGLCVVIPCSFTIASNFTTENIIWYKCELSKKRCNDTDIIFHTTKNNSKVQPGFKGRVSLLEPDVSRNNCSIIIHDLTESDSGSYQLRVNYLENGVSDRCLRANVSIKVLKQKPKVTISHLIEGQQTTLTCAAPGHSGSAPNITWTWRGAEQNNSHIKGNITAVKTEEFTAVTQRYNSTLTFNLSAEHNNTEVTCRVSFKNNITTEETVTLNVNYLLENLLTIITQPQVIIAFFAGILLSSTVCCLARKCCRRTTEDTMETLEMVTAQVVPLMDAGQSGENDGTREREAVEGEAEDAGQLIPDVGPKEVEYSDIDFSKWNGKGGANGTQETPETEYAELKKEGETEDRQDGSGGGGREDGGVVEVSEDKAVMMGEDETESTVKDDKEEEMAVYSNVNEIMAEI